MPMSESIVSIFAAQYATVVPSEAIIIGVFTGQLPAAAIAAANPGCHPPFVSVDFESPNARKLSHGAFAAVLKVS